ncbi:AlpA family transcriptional regulator [Pacificibacter maritimus]|uniref:AlpA family transcriptional regulator n=2 Tax=Pacificibacter maritimus TaxID=762213 RepID=A0A3N4U6R5_9RHOB|nr:AlpA family transcriptional regulator [Pacificibacter maritimus]
MYQPASLNQFTIQKISRRLLSVKEVAKITGLGVSTIWRNSKLGTFPEPIAICGMKRWRASDIERLVGDDVADPSVHSLLQNQD